MERPALKLTEEILLTVPETAKLLRTQPIIIRGLIQANKIKALKLGELKIRRAEIDRFLQDYEGNDLTDPFNIVSLANSGK